MGKSVYNYIYQIPNTCFSYNYQPSSYPTLISKRFLVLVNSIPLSLCKLLKLICIVMYFLIPSMSFLQCLMSGGGDWWHCWRLYWSICCSCSCQWIRTCPFKRTKEKLQEGLWSLLCLLISVKLKQSIEIFPYVLYVSNSYINAHMHTHLHVPLYECEAYYVMGISTLKFLIYMLVFLLYYYLD